MKLSTETKAGILVACSFLGLTGVFVGKKYFDPNGKIASLLSEGKPEALPSGPEVDPQAKGGNDKKDIFPEILLTQSQVPQPNGIPPGPEVVKPASSPAFPPPLGGPAEVLPGGLPPLPGTEVPPQNNNSSGSKPDPLAFPPIPPPTGVGSASPIPPLPGELITGNSQTNPINGPNNIPGTIPIPVPPPAAIGGLGTPAGTGLPPLGLPAIPSLESAKDVPKPLAVPSRGLGGSEFSPGGTPGFPPLTPPIGVPLPANPGLSGLGLTNSGTGAIGIAARGALAIPPVALTTFSPTTGPLKRTEFFPLDEAVSAPMAPPFVPALPGSGPNALPNPVPPVPIPPAGPSDKSGNMARRPPLGNNPNFAFVPGPSPSLQDKPILRMSANEALPPLGTGALQTNAPKVNSWSEKVFISSAGDTWDSIALSQYQRKDLARMLQQYNELHPRLAALPKSGLLPIRTEIFLPPLEELLRQGATAVPLTKPQTESFPIRNPSFP